VTIACMLAFRWAGMTWFDAVCHTFSTMGLGGFSTHDASFGYFDSPAIELVAIVFMLIAGMNFGTLFLAVSGRSMRPYLQGSGGRLVHRCHAGQHLHVSPFISGRTASIPTFDTAMRHAAFNVVSIATTTGYASVDYRPVADLRAPVDALPVELRHQRRLDRGRHQDDARPAALQAGQSRTAARHASQCGLPVRIGGQARRKPILFAVLGFLSCTWSASCR
jgi:trk system potassium uptake protein TrkH